MICKDCRTAGLQNTLGEGLLADILHSECINFVKDVTNYCDCQHVVTADMEPDYCPNCDGRKCMDCVLRYWHEECAADCPACCPSSPITVLECQVNEDWVDDV